MPLTPKEIMACARVMVRKRAPYLTTGVLGLIPKETPNLGTMAVSEHMVLYWDPAYVAKLTPEECMWDLLHEVSHVLRTHADRARTCNVPPENREMWNWASDAEINDDLITMGAKHHVPYVTPERIGCPNGGLAETYYHHLRQKQKDQQGGQGQGKDQGDGQGQQGGQGQSQGKGTPKPQCGAGWCGSGAGHPIPDEPDQKGQSKDKGRSAADVQRIKQQVAEQIRQEAAKSRGTVPGGWKVWADELLKPAKISWETKLARAIRSSVANRAGAVNYSYSRPSRRQAMYGFGLGKPVLPVLRSPVPRVGVGLDTSGSMGSAEIERAAAEIHGVLKAVRAEVDFLACDSSLHTVTKLRHARQFAEAFKGGGGTSFVPVFAHLETMRKPPEVFIFITDGQGDAPHHQPANIRHCIFVLVGKHQMTPYSVDDQKAITWGEHISIDD